jgi:hypothetical protein
MGATGSSEGKTDVLSSSTSQPAELLGEQLPQKAQKAQNAHKLQRATKVTTVPEAKGLNKTNNTGSKHTNTVLHKKLGKQKDYGKKIERFQFKCNTCANDFFKSQARQQKAFCDLVNCDSTTKAVFMERIVNVYAADIFSYMVMDLVTVNKPFDKARFRVNSNTFMTDNEKHLYLQAIEERETLLEKYVRTVLDKREYVPLASSGTKPTEIKTPEHWTQAIRNLQASLSQMQNQLSLLPNEPPKKQILKCIVDAIF